MKRVLKRIVSLIIVCLLSVGALTSCVTKLAEIFKMKTFVYSYETLSEGLLRIDFVNVTKTYDESGPKHNEEVYKTLSADEQEIDRKSVV